MKHRDYNLWLVGMTHNRKEDFEEIVKYADEYFDGMIYVDHFSDDGTYELLEAHKGKGKIIQREYVRQHSHSQNEILFCRHAKNGDWMFLNDSPERIKENWLKGLRDNIAQYEKSGVGAVVLSGRPYLWRYFDEQQFVGSPHWGISPIIGQSAVLPEDKKPEFIENKRDENPRESYCLHPIKYWFCHNPSNEPLIMYGQYGKEILQKHQQIRFNFRMHCEVELGMNLDTLDDLIAYMKKIHTKEIQPSEYFIRTMDEEFRLTELFQLEVLGMDFMQEIVPRRNQFCFYDWVVFGDGFRNPDFKSNVQIYEEQLKNQSDL